MEMCLRGVSDKLQEQFHSRYQSISCDLFFYTLPTSLLIGEMLEWPSYLFYTEACRCTILYLSLFKDRFSVM